MPPIPAEWFNVNKAVQIWSGHADNHKQFVMQPPAAIEAIEEYKGSYRFEKALHISGGMQVETTLLPDAGYPQLWIREEDVTKEEYVEPGGDMDPPPPPPEDEEGDPPPPPTPIPSTDNEALGAAINLILSRGGKVCMADNSRYGCC